MPAKRILVVEDDAVVRYLAVESLRDEGFDVTEAANGDIAINQLLDPDNFDVLLTDVRIPGERDGLEVMTYARELHPKIGVVIVSGYANDLTKRLPQLPRPFDFMTKPYRLPELIERVKQAAA